MSKASHTAVEAMLAAHRPSEPVTCVWPEAIRAAARRFVAGFPGQVLYAVKANPHPIVLAALHQAGVERFDVASGAEMEQVRALFPDAPLYFHNPVKPRRTIHRAYRLYRVRHFVVDHPAELAKVLAETDPSRIEIVVRMATSPGSAAQELSSKFGASPAEAVELLRAAAGAGAGAGLTFHLGTQCTDPAEYARAMELGGEVIAQAGVQVKCLDVGGGFPAPYAGQGHIPPLEDFFTVIREAWKVLALDRCELLCEPGRALVAGACSVAVQVRLRNGDRLHISDGPCGSLGDLWYQKRAAPVRLLRPAGVPAGACAWFTLVGPLGPDCDDELPVQFPLPETVREGDWIEIGELGAYAANMAMDLQRYHTDPFAVMTDRPFWTEPA
jgi:ornithine decarboxylase